MNENICNNLFVYGTLVDEELFNELFGIRPYDKQEGWIFAKMYDCGRFPMILQDPQQKVYGLVYLFQSLHDILPSIDRYECCNDNNLKDSLYERKLVDVTLMNGEIKTAWIYFGNVYSNFCRINCVSKNFLRSGRWALM